MPDLTHRRAKELLETYSFSELLEHNELTEEDVLVFLNEQGLLTLPEVEPL